MSAQSIDSRRLGRSSQAAAIETVDGIGTVPDEIAVHWDAVATEPISASPEIPVVGRAVVEQGTPIEIKSAAVVATSDQSRGRFYLRREQHETLVERGAVYLMVVSAPTPSRDVLAAQIVDAREVDEVVSSWIEPEDRATYAQVSWSRLFDPETVENV